MDFYFNFFKKYKKISLDWMPLNHTTHSDITLDHDWLLIRSQMEHAVIL